jgi:hypothetical protein
VARLGEPMIDMVLSACVFEGMRQKLLALIHGATEF